MFAAIHYLANASPIAIASLMFVGILVYMRFWPLFIQWASQGDNAMWVAAAGVLAIILLGVAV